jgi:alkaline phosphatase
MTSIPLTDAEQQAFAALIIGYEVANPITLDDLTDDHREQLRALMLQINGMINGRSYTGWTTGGHTGVDVNVYSMGKYAERFRGNMDNTKIGLIIKDVLTQSD